MSINRKGTLTILGCGNLGIAILKTLIAPKTDRDYPPLFDQYIACVRSDASAKRISDLFPHAQESKQLIVQKGDIAKAAVQANVVMLGVDPSDGGAVLQQKELRDALKGKLLISIMAGWTREQIEQTLGGNEEGTKDRTWVIRVLPNIAAQVSESFTAIEEPPSDTPAEHLEVTTLIFDRIGKTLRLQPRLMAAATAVGGSTPALFAVICDALIDASVAVGVPRASAQTMIYQAMQGTAAMLQSGVHPGILKDQGTSPEGCTIGGLMVLEEAGVRGHVGKALREAVTIARLMGSGDENLHVNDTRR